MALPDELETKLTNEGIVGGNTGWSLHAIRFPPSPDRVIKIVPTPGGTADEHGPTDEIPFQVMSRAEKGGAASALSKLREVFNSLRHTKGTIDGTEYGGIFAPEPPGFLRTDDNERDIFVANFRALRQRS